MIADFMLNDLIGQGGYGDIYSVHRIDDDQLFAMKVELLESDRQGLAQEIDILSKIQDSEHFPRIIATGVTDSIRYLVMNLFGLSVSNTRRLLPKRKMSLGTVTRIAIYMLECIEDLHSHGFIHRDIKPGNFLFADNGIHPLILIDFGLSREYIDRETGQPFPERPKSGFRGTSKYASLNAHMYKDQSQRDDLISWMYSIVELFNGKLQWTKAKDNPATCKMKQQISDNELFLDMPSEYIDIWKYVCHLRFGEVPKYELIKELLASILEKNNINYNDPFDWEYLPEKKVDSASPFVKLPLGSEMEINFKGYAGSDEITNNLGEKAKCVCCRI